MRRLMALMFVTTFLAVLSVGTLIAQVVDSLPGAIPPSGPLGWGASIAIGLGASLLTGLVGKGVTALDKVAGNVDLKYRQRVGPLLPGIVAGLSIVLPWATSALGVTDVPPADAIANAPLSAIIGVAAREAVRKWLVPLVGRAS